MAPIADKDTAGVNELYSVPVGGGTVAKHSGSLVAGGKVTSFTLSPDSSRVVFDWSNGAGSAMYSAPSIGGPATRLFALASSFVASGWRVTPDGSHVALAVTANVGPPLLFSATFIGHALDIDGNGVVYALTDGLTLLRWQFGLRGAALINGAVGPNPTRNAVQLIEAYLSTQTFSGAP